MPATLPAPFVTLAPSTPAPMRSRALLAGTMGKELGKVAVLRREALGYLLMWKLSKNFAPKCNASTNTGLENLSGAGFSEVLTRRGNSD